MAALQRQIQYLKQELQCSATLEHSLPHVRLYNLAIPWCGRQLHWQVLIPSPHGAPDFVFDTDSFRPLCPPPHRPHQPLFDPHQQRAAAGVAALRALLRGWAADPHPAGPDSLCRLVGALLDAYRVHQLGRLEAAAAALPRLQFELSTLELGPGVQLELQQHQACFSLPLPSLDLRRLMELAELYGARLLLPPEPQGSVAQQLPPEQQGSAGATAYATAQPQQLQTRRVGAAGGPEAAAGAATPGSAGGALMKSNDDVLEPLEETAEGYQDGDRRSNQLGAGRRVSAAAAAATQQQQQPALLHLALLASFRLPAGGGGDLSEPELSLQVPPALSDVRARASTATSATTSTSTCTSAAAGSPLQLVPSFLLPLWTPHMCLAEFVPMAVERLQGQVDAHCSLLAARHQILDHLGEMLGAPLELNLWGGVALFSLAWEGHSVLACVDLGTRFPGEKPTVVLQCVRQLNAADASRTYRDYPWSPRWGPREMAARIHNWLREELPNFMRGRVPAPAPFVTSP